MKSVEELILMNEAGKLIHDHPEAMLYWGCDMFREGMGNGLVKGVVCGVVATFLGIVGGVLISNVGDYVIALAKSKLKKE